ncbi:MAG: DUF1189 domain-containing protein [Bacillota bacterium]
MEGQKIKFTEKLIKSISSFGFYQRILKESLGKAFIYLVLISLLFGFAGSIKAVYDINFGVNAMIDGFRDEIPDFTFQNGELEVYAEMPMILEEGEGAIVVIDTTGQTDESILDDYDSGVFLSKHKLVSKENSIQTKEFDFSQIKEFDFNKQDVERWIPFLKWMSVIAVIFILLGTIIGKLISTLFISLLGLIVNGIAKARLEYGNIYKIGIYAITLPTIIKTVMGLVSIQIPFFFVIYYGIVVFYLWKVMKLIREEKEAWIEMDKTKLE